MVLFKSRAIFTARCRPTIVQRAVLRLHVVRPSVVPSVFVTLVDQDHTGWGNPIISGMGKATNFKFCKHIHRIDLNKSPLKIAGK